VPKKAEGPCIVDGCEKTKRALGYCSPHYQLLRKYGRTDRIRVKNKGTICEFDGCQSPAVKRGYCDIHRKRLRRADPETKVQRKFESLWHDRKSAGILCQEWTDFDQFCAGIGERPSLSHSLMRKDERLLYGPTNFQWIKERPRKKRPTKVHDWHDDGPTARRTKYRDRDKYRRYGITVEQFNEMHARQNGLCAICGSAEKRAESKRGKIMQLVVDHCHATLKVRSLLCWRCNIGLGVAKDSIPVLEKMIDYLRFHHPSEGDNHG
jgi:hypothetical protein